MPTGFAVEAMRLEDVTEVVEVERACFSLPWPASAYKRELKNPSSTRYLIVRQYLTEPTNQPPLPPKKTSLISKMLPFLHVEEVDPKSPKNPNPVAGYGGLWLMMDEAHITTLGVSPEYRGKSLGEFLLIGLIDIALELGASWLTLEVRVSNNVAQNLYHKYTFKEAGVRRKYYTDNNEDAYIMWSDELSKLSFRELFKKNKADLLQKLANRGELAAPAGTRPQIDPAKLLVVPEVHEGPYVQPPPMSGPIATEETLSHSENSEKNR